MKVSKEKSIENIKEALKTAVCLEDDSEEFYDQFLDNLVLDEFEVREVFDK